MGDYHKSIFGYLKDCCRFMKCCRFMWEALNVYLCIVFRPVWIVAGCSLVEMTDQGRSGIFVSLNEVFMPEKLSRLRPVNVLINSLGLHTKNA